MASKHHCKFHLTKNIVYLYLQIFIGEFQLVSVDAIVNSTLSKLKTPFHIFVADFQHLSVDTVVNFTFQIFESGFQQFRVNTVVQ